MINNIINRHLSLGYDIEKGFVLGEEEVAKHVDQVVEHLQTAEELKLQSGSNLLEVIRSLGKISYFTEFVAVNLLISTKVCC